MMTFGPIRIDEIKHAFLWEAVKTQLSFAFVLESGRRDWSYSCQSTTVCSHPNVLFLRGRKKLGLGENVLDIFKLKS